MSTAQSNNAGCGKVLLYLLLAGVGLWAGTYVLQGLYYGFSYLGANALLALDLSVYGQALPGYWPGYALLGLGLGAAAGAVAAQRRFGLSRAVAVAGWLVGLALLALVYATVFSAEESVAGHRVSRAAPVPRATEDAATLASLASGCRRQLATAGWPRGRNADGPQLPASLVLA